MSSHHRVIGLAVIAFLAMLVPVAAQAPAPGTISTIAGGVPNNVPALSVSTEGEEVAKDSAGNVYVSSPDFSMVLEVTPSGQASTIAGNGSFGYSGDGGPATGAQLGCPVGIALDSSGDLFMADYCDNVIREVVASTGTIETVAGDGSAGYLGDGSAATAAQLSQPIGVFVDAAGNIFIADSGNNAVREVACGTGASGCTPPAGEVAGDIYTVAGNGTAGYSGDGAAATSAALNGPWAVSADPAGNLFVADTYNNRVRQVVCATAAAACTPPTGETAGYIYTVAGNGTAGYSGNGGPATSARLDEPTGVFVDAMENLFIADYANSVIREVSAGTINTIAGNGVPGFSGDGGPPLSAQLNFPTAILEDSAGNLLIGDSQNNRVREVSGGNIATLAGNGFPSYSGDGGPATAAQLSFPFAYGVGMATDSAGDFFVADAGANVVREVLASSGDIQTIAGTGGAGFAGDNGSATSAVLNSPSGVAIDPSGNVYIADTLNNVIREVFAATGTISTIAGDGAAGYTGDGGAATSASLQQPFGVRVDVAGNLFIADTGNNVIREVICATGASTCTPPAGETAGDIYTVAGNGTAGFSGDGGPAPSAELQQPTSVSLDQAGDIFIADSANNVIREVSGGMIETIAGNGAPGYSGDNGPAPSAMLDGPYDVSVDDAGNLFISDFNNTVIREVVCATAAGGCVPPTGEMAGDIYTIAGDGNPGFSGDGGPAASAELNFPSGMATDSSGDLLVADTYANRVRTLAGVADIASAGLSPNSLLFTPAQVLNASPSSQNVTLTNSGNYPLNISGIAISGNSDFAETNTCGPLPASVPPGGSCTLTATFQASGTGPRAATLTINDSDMSSPQSIPVSGAGIDFSVGAAPGGSTSATVSAGQTASYALQVSATGGFAPTDQLSVAIACTGAPSGATCSGPASPISVTPSAPGAFTVTVPTTARSSLPPFMAPGPRPGQKLLLGISALFLILLFFTWKARQNSPVTASASTGGRLALTIPAALLLFSLACLAGCGGSPTHSQGTSPGAYTLKVQATTGGVSRSVQLTLTVQ